MLNDPEPPPQPWWIKALGAASAVVVLTSSIVALLGPGDGRQHHVAAPTPITQPPPFCDPDKGRGLHALGAAPLDWASAHVAAYSPFGIITRWNPDPRLPRYRGHEGAVYNSMATFGQCAVSSYYIRLVRPSTTKAALRRALKELPADAHLLWHRDLSRCAQYQFVSHRLDSQLRQRTPKFFATSALVRLVEAPPGAKQSVTRIALSLNDAPSPVAAGGCAV